MSEVIQAPNFDSVNLKEATLLDADTAAGQNLVTLLNTSTFSAGEKVLLGNRAQENAEVVVIQSIASKVVTLVGTAKNTHYRFEAFTLLFGDQIRLYRAANVDGTVPSDSDFSYLSIYATIEGDDVVSDLIDPTGGAGYWYKTTYYNSGLGDETSLSLSVAVRGGNYGSLVSIESIRNEAGLTDNTQIGDPRIAEIRATSEGEVLARIAAASYTLPLQTASGVLFTPPVVEAMARILSAGRLLTQEFQGGEEAAKNGAQKIKDVQGMFDALIKNELMLLDETGVPMARATDVSGWPDDTTQFVGTDGQTPEPIQIRMSTRF